MTYITNYIDVLLRVLNKFIHITNIHVTISPNCQIIINCLNAITEIKQFYVTPLVQNINNLKYCYQITFQMCFCSNNNEYYVLTVTNNDTENDNYLIFNLTQINQETYEQKQELIYEMHYFDYQLNSSKKLEIINTIDKITNCTNINNEITKLDLDLYYEVWKAYVGNNFTLIPNLSKPYYVDRDNDIILPENGTNIRVVAKLETLSLGSFISILKDCEEIIYCIKIYERIIEDTYIEYHWLYSIADKYFYIRYTNDNGQKGHFVTYVINEYDDLNNLVNKERLHGLYKKYIENENISSINYIQVLGLSKWR